MFAITKFRCIEREVLFHTFSIAGAKSIVIKRLVKSRFHCILGMELFLLYLGFTRLADFIIFI